MCVHLNFVSSNSDDKFAYLSIIFVHFIVINVLCAIITRVLW